MLPLPPVDQIPIGPQEVRAVPVRLPAERIPAPDQLPGTRQEDKPEDVRKNEGEQPGEGGDDDKARSLVKEKIRPCRLKEARPDLEQHEPARKSEQTERPPVDRVKDGISVVIGGA